jgi:hypothetical protein
MASSLLEDQLFRPISHCRVTSIESFVWLFLQERLEVDPIYWDPKVEIFLSVKKVVGVGAALVWSREMNESEGRERQ